MTDDTPNGMFLDGRWERAGETFPVLDPARSAVIAQVASASNNDIDRAVEAASRAFGLWRRVPAYDRGAILRRIAHEIFERLEALAELVTLDSGKPLSQARSDVRTAAKHFEFYGGAADKVGGRELPLDDDHVTYTRWEPRGVTAHITPGNNPISIPSRSIAAALSMGNTVVVKPSELAPLPVLALAQIVRQSDLPRGAFNAVPGLGPEAGAPLAAHEGVGCVTFTGSVSTGAAVMQAAAPNITPVSLELGGKAPQLVFEDADVDRAVAGCVFGIIRNAGQSCIAGTRLYVAEPLYEELLEAVAARLRAVTIGPGLDDPDMGPLISHEQLDAVLGQLETARGTIICGGGRPDMEGDLANGFFMEPTLVSDVDPTDPVATEELFAPVATIAPFGDEARRCAWRTTPDSACPPESGHETWAGTSGRQRAASGLGVRQRISDPLLPRTSRRLQAERRRTRTRHGGTAALRRDQEGRHPPVRAANTEATWHESSIETAATRGR